MSKYKRYVVVGSKKLIEHSYDASLNNSYVYAVDCANHPTMQGRVFGEGFDGSRALLYTFKNPNSK